MSKIITSIYCKFIQYEFRTEEEREAYCIKCKNNCKYSGYVMPISPLWTKIDGEFIEYIPD